MEEYIQLANGRLVRLGQPDPGPVAPAGPIRVAWGDVTLPTLEERITMTSPPVMPQFPGGVFSDFVEKMNRDIAKSRQTPEQEFQSLDVQIGDRIRLTQVNSGTQGGLTRASARRAPADAAVLEGQVLGIKQKNGSQVRITGFDHTGPSRAGGQHVWFAVADYRVEVLHKVYRITDEDRLIAAVANISEDRWGKLTDSQRERYRRDYTARAERVKHVLAAKPDLISGLID